MRPDGPAARNRRLFIQPFVREFFRVGTGIVGDDLAGAEELPFIDEQALEAYGSAGVDFVGADADFGAEVVTEAVIKTCAAIPEDTPRIDKGHKPFSLFLIRRNDRVSMSRAKAVDVLNRLFQAVNDFYREDSVQILG